METVEVVILSLSSLMLVFVGVMRLSNPIKTYEKNSGIKLENNVDLLNEMRGVSAVMLCGGIIALLGAINPGIRLTAFIVAALIFVGFLIGRLTSMAVDGKPNKQLIQGIVFELIFGAANVFGILMLI